ncbi:MAG: 3-hydroxyacyl-CoA dehydrogenase NAD-binding domain-containing protein [Planctomycetota bacterium]
MSAITITPSTAIGVLGAGTMGSGIAQVAATAGHPVVLCDSNAEVLARAKSALEKVHARLVEKGKIDQATCDAILGRIRTSSDTEALTDSGVVIEAIIENLGIKQSVFASLEEILGNDAILATNTSSLAITAIAGACRKPERVVGMHFFNPAALMPLVEIVPGVATSAAVTAATKDLATAWKKVPVLAQDTPGFIVNRVARPFYGEAIRILEEGIADAATIDHAMREVGGFRMGPFELMDLIGNDINLTVTESVFEAFFYDPRFKPSFTQKRLVQAGRLGRKSGHGYFSYAEGAPKPEPDTDPARLQAIVDRILAMLINEAADAVFLRVATPTDVDLAMTKGVNYPKGLLAWADELGPPTILARLEALQAEYGEDRYRPNPLLRRVVREGRKFHSA